MLELLLLIGQNPHLANLAWADAFVITADSVSMLSEACSTGYEMVEIYVSITFTVVFLSYFFLGTTGNQSM